MNKIRDIYKDQSGFVYLGALIAAIIILVSSVGIYMWVIRGINITQQDLEERSSDINVRSLFEEARSAAATGFVRNQRNYWRLGMLKKSYKPVPLLRDLRDLRLVRAEGSVRQEWSLDPSDPYDVRFMVGVDNSGNYLWDKPPQSLFIGENLGRNSRAWTFKSKRYTDRAKISNLNNCRAIKWTLKATGDCVVVEVLEEPVSRSRAGGVKLHYTMIAQ